MPTPSSSQATWATNTNPPTPNREDSNHILPSFDRTEDNEVYEPDQDRFRRSPAPSLSPTLAEFAAMGHVAEEGVGEEPFNYADLHLTSETGQNLGKNSVPKVIPRLRSLSRSSSLRSPATIGGLQTFQGSQHTRSTIVNQRPRVTDLDSSRALYSMGPAVDQVGVINNNERALDLDAFWTEFKLREENFAELPDRVFH